MKFRQILNTKLEFKKVSGPYFGAQHEGQEIGFMVGDHPADDMYYIYFNRKQIHEGQDLPRGWSVREE